MKLKKTLILLYIFILIISVVSVTCFADTSNGIFFKGDSITWNDKLIYTFSEEHYLWFNFSYERDGTTYYCEALSVEDNGEYDYTVTYLREDGQQDVVYETRWILESAKTITIEQDLIDFGNTELYGNALPFIYQNAYDGTVKYPVYDSLHGLIVKYVFNDKPLYYEQELSVSLVCLALSLVIVATPLLVILWLMRWITTLGRSGI